MMPMHDLWPSLLPALLSLAPLMAMTTGAAATEVTITVAHAQASAKVFGQIFADAASFKSRDRAVLRFAIEPSGGVARTTVALPPGVYAIALFQDTKGTGKMETGLFGSPSVPYGFSNNARGSMGPPAFDDAAFRVGASAAVVSIELR